MSQKNRVSIVRNDFPKKDTGIQMYVKLKGLKDKKGGKGSEYTKSKQNNSQSMSGMYKEHENSSTLFACCT
jgi:hypothetical protein